MKLKFITDRCPNFVKILRERIGYIEDNTIQVNDLIGKTHTLLSDRSYAKIICIPRVKATDCKYREFNFATLRKRYKDCLFVIGYLKRTVFEIIKYIEMCEKKNINPCIVICSANMHKIQTLTTFKDMSDYTLIVDEEQCLYEQTSYGWLGQLLKIQKYFKNAVSISAGCIIKPDLIIGGTKDVLNVNKHITRFVNENKKEVRRNKNISIKYLIDDVIKNIQCGKQSVVFNNNLNGGINSNYSIIDVVKEKTGITDNDIVTIFSDTSRNNINTAMYNKEYDCRKKLVVATSCVYESIDFKVDDDLRDKEISYHVYSMHNKFCKHRGITKYQLEQISRRGRGANVSVNLYGDLAEFDLDSRIKDFEWAINQNGVIPNRFMDAGKYNFHLSRIDGSHEVGCEVNTIVYDFLKRMRNKGYCDTIDIKYNEVYHDTKIDNIKAKTDRKMIKNLINSVRFHYDQECNIDSEQACRAWVVPAECRYDSKANAIVVIRNFIAGKCSFINDDKIVDTMVYFAKGSSKNLVKEAARISETYREREGIRLPVISYMGADNVKYYSKEDACRGLKKSKRDIDKYITPIYEIPTIHLLYKNY